MRKRNNNYQYTRATGRKQTKKRSRTLPWLFVAAITAAYVIYACLRPIAYAIELSITPPASGQAHIVWPANGQAAIGIEGQGVVATSPGQHIAPIASLTKLVTALAILEKKPLQLGQEGDTIAFTNNDATIYQQVIAQDGAGISVQPGQTMTEHQALQAMILASANNIAISLSNWVFGSEQAYADYANAMLSRAGFTQTHIAGASGLENGTTSTPSELIQLAAMAMHSPVLADITALDEVTVPGFPSIRNINHASKLAHSVHAMKVGLTDQAGACLLFWTDVQSPDFPSERIYGVILGQPEFSALETYVNYLVQQAIPSNFSYVHVVTSGTPVATYIDKNGELITASAKEDITIPHWQGQQISLNVPDTSTTPSLHITTAKLSKDYPLVLNKRPNFAISWRLLHPF